MRDTFTEIERARSALWSLDAGCDRDTWVRYGMGAKAGGLAFEDFLSWSEGAGNFKSEVECRSVWNSFTDGGVTAASLFRAALAAGWTDGTEKPRRARTPPRQKEPEQPKASKPPLHDPLTLWNACTPATATNEYVTRKLGLHDGLREYHGNLSIAGTPCDGALVLPAYSLDGELVSLQFVPAEGKKVFLPGCKLPPDGCLVIGGPIRASRPVYVVEGVGQAWSAHQATSAPAVVCFGSARMAGVAKALRERHQDVALCLVADGGKESQCATIAKVAQGSWVEMPKGSPSNYDLNDFHKAHGLKASAALLLAAKSAPQRFRLLTPAQLGELPPIRWRVRGVLPADGIGAIFGPSGSGKSFLALDMLACVAAGRPWFGCRVNSAPVLYCALEGEAGIAQRIAAHQKKHGPLPDGFRFLLQGLDIRIAADRADLVQAALAAGFAGGILAIDTLNRAAPGADENDSAAMGLIIATAKALQAELGGLVLLVHHTGKDASKGLRGHSSLHAALDAAIEVSRDGDRREWKVAKSKDGDDEQGHPFRLEVVTLGTDDDGEEITSCVIVPENDQGEGFRRVLPPKSGNQRIIWDALQDVLKKSPSYGKAGAAPTRPCVTLEDAIEQTRSRLVCDSKRQTERTQSAISGLVARGLLNFKEGWLWIA
jgi:hypothetical protein